MRRTALLVVLALPLAACASGASSDTAASSSSSSASSTAASRTAATTSASLEAGVQRDCLTTGLDYVPLKTALSGSDADLISTLQVVRTADLNATGESQPGKDAELALAELNVEVATAHALATANVAPDRAKLQQAYTAAGQACLPFGAHF